MTVFAPAYQNTSVILTSHVSRNVYLTRTAREIKHVSETNAKIHASELVEVEPFVKL